ncbi:MAG: TatD family deoxyribonuclease, partial [Desulfuromonas sp.]
IDTHVHLDACPPCDEALNAAREVGVRGFIVPGIESANWPRLLQLAETHPDVYAAPGLHPRAAAEWSPELGSALEQCLRHPRTVAVGEIGLDRLLEGPPLPLQKETLRKQLRIAISAGKPVLIHCRKAYGDLLQILIEEGVERVGGILHAYGGSLETARSAIDLGFAIAFGGVLTWPDVRRAPEVLCGIPEEAIVLESDAPDMAPHPHRGKRNQPCWLPLIAARVATLRGWSLEHTAEVSGRNARRILGLDDLPGETT